MRVSFYVDGFNLYFGAIRGTPYRWLDLGAVCRHLARGEEVRHIRYFTAPVQSGPEDPDKHRRQYVYLRALGTVSGLSIHKGQFLSRRVRLPLADPPPNGPRTVEVLRREEKGSDVNLASYLLVDAFERDFDRAVVLSNDSDLMEPIRLVRERFDLPVGVYNPHRNTSWALQQVASFYRPLRSWVLKESLFPDELSDSKGPIHKPAGW